MAPAANPIQPQADHHSFTLPTLEAIYGIYRAGSDICVSIQETADRCHFAAEWSYHTYLTCRQTGGHKHTDRPRSQLHLTLTPRPGIHQHDRLRRRRNGVRTSIVRDG